jgi:inward rectifier potassium channel
VQFAKHPTIGPYDGAPMLQLRIGNERDSRLLEAVIRVVLMRTEKTKEGVTIYRMHDLKLERERSPALSRSWTVLHKIDETSKLYEATPESLERDEVELILTLSGTDELSAQMLYAQTRYLAKDIRWGARHADMLSERPDGRLRLDLRQFHEVVPTKPTDDFPYGTI